MSCTAGEKPNNGSSLLKVSSTAWLTSRAGANCPLGGNRSYSSMNSHKCPAHERGDIRDSHAGPGQASFRHDPWLKLLHRERYSVCVSAAQDPIQQPFVVRYSLLPLQRSFWLWDLQHILFQMFFPELLLLLFKGHSKPDDVPGIWGQLSISDEWKP